MGYFDKYLMHEDGRDKGMNSTSSEKGTDGKKNNTSEYNHQYYMKNKEKWRDNNKSSVSTKIQYYKDGDSDFDNDNYDRQNWVDGTDFYIKEKPDGSIIVLEEDMKWTLPPGTNKEQLRAALKDFDKRIDDMYNKGEKYDWEKLATEAINSVFKKPASGEKEFDVDAAARDVIRGKYGNGADRKAALGDDYAEVQKRVNEILGGKTSSEPKKTSKNTSKPVDGPKETPHANFPSSNSTSSAPRARKKNVTGNGTGLYVRGKVAHAERGFNAGYFYRDDELAHHGIKGQKWGVRRFENADGTLTAAGRARYGDKADKVEKAMTKAARYESKAANAKTRFGRQWNTDMAVSARARADIKADKASGDYNTFHSNKNNSRIFGAKAEANASIAQKLKDRAANEINEKKAKKLMNEAVKRLATAENAETYAKAYKSVANAKGIINKGVAYINAMESANKTKYTEAGRKVTKGDSFVEGLGDSVLSNAFGMNLGGLTGGLRDRSYKKKNTAEQRWDNIVGKEKKTKTADTSKEEKDVVKSLSKSADKRSDISDEEREIIRELERDD